MKQKDTDNNRLLTLAEHLAKEKLHRVDMKLFSQPVPEEMETVRLTPDGCAIRTFYWAVVQLPFLWPNHFAFRDDSLDVIARNGLNGVEAMIEFFNLNADELFHLFVPTGQNPEFYGGRILSINAKPRELSEVIVAFVAKRMTHRLTCKKQQSGT